MEGNRIFQLKRNSNDCFHDKGVIVCEETRTIECSQCESKMSAWDYLHKMCFSEDSALKRLTALQTEVNRLEKRYYTLNKEIERLNKVKKAIH